MAKSENQKLKLLYLAELFRLKTDEEHAITMSEIIMYLERENIKAERKSIYDDIELLRNFGLDIVAERRDKTCYYSLVNRDFELAELKILVDTVQASKFITQKKSSALIHKLERLASSYEAKELNRQVYVNSRIKTMNESIYYNVDAINDAMNKNRQINFDYYEWTLQKELEKRPNGDKKGISPWGLIWDDENYYLIAFDSLEQKIKHYRVDKMRKIKMTDVKRIGQEEFKKHDLGSYTNKVFGMYGGAEENVTLEVENRLIGVIMDRFGKDVMIVPQDEEKFRLHIPVEISPLFLSWVVGFGKSVKVISPQSVVDQIKEMGQQLLDMYK